MFTSHLHSKKLKRISFFDCFLIVASLATCLQVGAI
nr:MAG TPA: hypothetical protein [Caudoviricetes sp.]